MTGITQVNSIIKHDQKSQKSIEWWVSVWLQEPLRIIHLGSVCLYYKAMDSNGPCRVTDVTTDHNSFLWNEPQYRLTPGAGKLGQVPCCLNLCGCLLYKSSFVIFFKTRLPSVPRNDKGLVAIINLYGWSLLRPDQVAVKAATCTYSRRIQDGKSENHSEHNTCRHITILGATQIRFPAIVKWWSHEPEFEVWDAFGNAANGQLWCVSQVPRLFWDLFIPVLCLEINVLMIQTLWTTCRINNMCVAWNMTASR